MSPLDCDMSLCYTVSVESINQPEILTMQYNFPTCLHDVPPPYGFAVAHQRNNSLHSVWLTHDLAYEAAEAAGDGHAVYEKTPGKPSAQFKWQMA